MGYIDWHESSLVVLGPVALPWGSRFCQVLRGRDTAQYAKLGLKAFSPELIRG